MRFGKYTYTILLLLTVNYFYTQNKIIDSLRLSLKRTKEDTNKVKLLNELSVELSKYYNADSAIVHTQKAIELAKELNWEKGEASSERLIGIFLSRTGKSELALAHFDKAFKICENLVRSEDVVLVKSGNVIKGRSFNNVGTIYFRKGDYQKALNYYFLGLNLLDSIGEKKAKGVTLGNIGNVYAARGEYPNALKYYFEGLKISEEVGDKEEVGSKVGNIGNIYKDLAEYSKALNYYSKGFIIAEQLGNKRGMATILNNLGLLYIEQGRDSVALGYYLKSLKIAEETNDKAQTGVIYTNIGNIHHRNKDYDNALLSYLRALKVAQELEDKTALCIILGNIGNLKISLRQYTEAENYLKKALAISKEIYVVNVERDHEKYLSQLYEKIDKPALAFEHYKRYIILKDTLSNIENKKLLIRRAMNYDFEKKEAILKEQQEKERLVAQESNRKQKAIIWSSVVGLVLLIGFSAFVLRSLRVVRKQKKLIERQKHLVDEKQKEILDSIHYAQRIQKALITNEKYFEKKLNDLVN